MTLVEEGPHATGPMTAVIAHGPCAVAYMKAKNGDTKTPTAAAGACLCFYFARHPDVVDKPHVERDFPGFACMCGASLGVPCYADVRVTYEYFKSHDEHG